ncbi:hypothetical protein [Staphylococcus chromogenes]|uniref:hypothetical protein n=1 Tax=Staphylococcus chromogenes TaxID=46126 RepID=UPI0028859B17|nr:hypothetical protein [Staphylococcus chromogenes]MDT0700457.1 hypothetical protein [Staphylococcus chromogenes]
MLAKERLLQYWDYNENTKAVGLGFDAQCYDEEDKYELTDRAHDQIRMDASKGLLGLGMEEEDKKELYILYVEGKDNESSFKLDNIEETKKKYDNVEIFKEK